jgi:TonB family protein
MTSGLRRPSAGFFQWEGADSPIAVHFHLNTVELLERDAIRAGSKLTAGILLGKKDDSRGPAFIVETYEPIPAATWKTTDSPFGDPRQLKAVIDRWQSKTDKRMSFLGFYRSGASTETTLSEDDFSILNSLGQSESIFLLIEPRSGKPSNGLLFMAKDGGVTFEWKRTPFNRPELCGRGIARPQEVRLPIEQPAPARLEEGRQTSVPAESNLGSPRKWEWVAGSVIVFLLLAAGFYALRGRKGAVSQIEAPETSLNSDFGLKLDRIGNDWRLSWNPNVEAIAKATSGELSIVDGTLQKTVELNASDLRSGAIVYSPVTNDVVLKLQVSGDDSSEPVSSSIRIVGGLPTTSAVSSTNAVNSSSYGQVTSEETIRPILSDEELEALDRKSRVPYPSTAGRLNSPPVISTKNDGGYQPEGKRIPSSASSAKSTDNRLRKLTIAPGGSEVSKAKRPTAPESEASLSRNTLSNMTPKAGAPLSGTVNLQPETVPVIAAKPAETATASITRPNRRGGAVQPAQLLSNINPSYPASAKVDGISGTVELHFKIGPTGDVHDIAVVKGPAILAQAAVQAVRDRKYKPARVDGVPTETDASAIFDFKLN